MNTLHEELARAHRVELLSQASAARQTRQIVMARRLQRRAERLQRRAERAAHQARLAVARVI